MEAVPIKILGQATIRALDFNPVTSRSSPNLITHWGSSQ